MNNLAKTLVESVIPAALAAVFTLSGKTSVCGGAYGQDEGYGRQAQQGLAQKALERCGDAFVRQVGLPRTTRSTDASARARYHCDGDSMSVFTASVDYQCGD